MRDKIYNFRKTIALVCGLLVMLCTIGISAVEVLAANAPDKLTIYEQAWVSGTQVDYADTVWSNDGQSITTSMFEAFDTDNSLKYSAICADPLKRTPFGPYNYLVSDGSLRKYSNEDIMTKVYYFGMIDDNPDSQYARLDHNYRVLLTHSCLSAVLHGIDNEDVWNSGYYYECKDGSRDVTILNQDGINWVHALYEYASQREIGSEYWSAALIPDNDEYQVLIVFGEGEKNQPVTGELTIYKSGQVLSSHDNNGYVEGEVGATAFEYEEKKLSGFEFMVTAKTDTFIGGVKQFSAGDVVEQSIATGEDGSVSIKNLGMGTYTVTEINAGEGFMGDYKDNHEVNSHDVTISYIDQNTEVVFENVTIHNERQKVAVEITKKDAESNVSLAGAKFTLYAAKNIRNNDGTVIITADEALETVETDSNGIAHFTLDLPIAEYYVKETLAPSYTLTNNIKVAYKLSSEKFGFVFEAMPQEQAQSIVSKTFYDEAYKGMASIKKIDETSGEPVKSENSANGAIYGLYAAQDILAPDNSGRVIISSGALVKEVALDNNSTGSVNDLYFGRYYWQEIKAPYGYVLSDKKYEFTLDNDNRTSSITASDKASLGSISIYKKGEVLKGFIDGKFIYEDAYIGGAVIEVRAAQDIYTPDNKGVLASYNGVLLKKGALVATVTTVDKSAVTVDKLPLGTYTVTEIRAPKGYVLNAESSMVNLEYKNDVQTIVSAETIYNDRKNVVVTVVKKDEETNERLEHATYGLYATKDVYDSEGNVLIATDGIIETIVTNKEGVATFQSDLPVGDYYTKEIKAPVGYQVSDEVNVVAFDEPGELLIETFDKATKIKETQARINGKQTIEEGKDFTIVDTVSLEELVIGQNYTLEGTLVDRFTGKELQKSRVTFTANNTSEKIEMTFDVEYENVKDNEVMTVFQDLYQDDILISSHHEIENVNQTVNLVKTDAKEEITVAVVETGDDSNPLIYAVIMLLAIGTLLSVRVFIYKSNYK